MQSYTEKLRKANEKANQVATEAVMNIRTVAAFTREDTIIQHFENKMKEPIEVAKKNAHIKGFFIGLGICFSVKIRLICRTIVLIWIVYFELLVWRKISS